MQSRYYNPAWGRFLNADGHVNANGDILGYNMYAYCSNNPVMHVDPTGEVLGPTWIFLGLLGVALLGGGAIGHISGYNAGERGWDLALSTIRGAAAGLAIGGGAMAAAGAIFIATAGAGTTILGVSALKVFAYGALAYNAVACVSLPLFGIEMEPIEYGPPAPSAPIHAPDFSPHPAQ